jgi:hypothetical protein
LVVPPFFCLKFARLLLTMGKPGDFGWAVWHSVLEVVVGMLLVVLNCYSMHLLSVPAPWFLARCGCSSWRCL